MKIAIDIDDVLLENTAAVINYSRKRDKTPLKLSDFTSRRVWEILNISVKESRKIILDYYRSKEFKNIKMMPNSDKVISYLSKNYDLHVVTNRPMFTKNITILQLNKYYGEVFKKIHFLGQYQKELDSLCKKKDFLENKLKPDYLIEDDGDIIKDIDLTKIKAIVFSWPWNNDVQSSENVIKVKNWKEVEEFFRSKL